jgi:hypothetical protein
MILRVLRSKRERERRERDPEVSVPQSQVFCRLLVTDLFVG